MLLAFNYLNREDAKMFIIIGCIAIVLLLILWFILRMYYKKTDNSIINEKEVISHKEPTLVAGLDVCSVNENASEKHDSVPRGEECTTSVVTNVLDQTEHGSVIHAEFNECELSKIEENNVVNTPFDDSVTPVIRYKKSFIAKLILNKELQLIYEEVRDHIMSYNKVKSRLSFKYERFSIGRQALVKMLVRGKKLYLYLALDPNLQEPKYHLQDVSSKRIGRELPSLLKVLSPRSIKYAKQLIDKLMEANEIPLINPDRNDKIDYKDLLRRRSLEQLIKDGLIIEYQMKGSFLNKVSSDYLTKEEIKAITPDEADKLVSDEHLNNVVKTKQVKRFGKMDIVNIDALNDNFEDGDYVDLETIIEVGLISKQARRVKVLARGELKKKLTVEADAFSKQAMKMIVYKGGEVILLK